jgi:hypothetical protein
MNEQFLQAVSFFREGKRSSAYDILMSALENDTLAVEAGLHLMLDLLSFCVEDITEKDNSFCREALEISTWLLSDDFCTTSVISDSMYGSSCARNIPSKLLNLLRSEQDERIVGTICFLLAESKIFSHFSEQIYSLLPHILRCLTSNSSPNMRFWIYHALRNLISDEPQVAGRIPSSQLEKVDIIHDWLGDDERVRREAFHLVQVWPEDELPRLLHGTSSTDRMPQLMTSLWYVSNTFIY